MRSLSQGLGGGSKQLMHGVSKPFEANMPHALIVRGFGRAVRTIDAWGIKAFFSLFASSPI